MLHLVEHALTALQSALDFALLGERRKVERRELGAFGWLRRLAVGRGGHVPIDFVSELMRGRGARMPNDQKDQKLDVGAKTQEGKGLSTGDGDSDLVMVTVTW